MPGATQLKVVPCCCRGDKPSMRHLRCLAGIGCICEVIVQRVDRRIALPVVLAVVVASCSGGSPTGTARTLTKRACTEIAAALATRGFGNAVPRVGNGGGEALTMTASRDAAAAAKQDPSLQALHLEIAAVADAWPRLTAAGLLDRLQGPKASALRSSCRRELPEEFRESSTGGGNPTPTTQIAAPATQPTARASSAELWDQIVAADRGVWAFENQHAWGGPEHPRLARLDPTTGRVLTEVHGDAVPTAWLAVEAADALWTGSRPGREGAGTVVVFDARTLAVLTSIPIADGPVAIGRGGASLWAAGDHALYRVDPKTRAIAATIDVPGAPISGIAVDPSGTRLYLEQFSDRQQTSLSVRSARDGVVLVAPRVVDAGPGPGRIAATVDGVWIAQATGMLGHVQQYPTDLVVGVARIDGSNGISVRTDAGVVLVNGATDDPALTCLDRKSGRFIDVIAVSQISALPAFTSDGTRLYLAPPSGGIEVRDVPPACKP